MIELNNHLSPDSTYRVAITNILVHLQEVSNSSIYEVVDITNTSRTTIWRMLQMLGYENFSEFRMALKQATQNYTYYNRVAGGKHADDGQILTQIADQMEASAALVRSSLKEDELLQMAQRVSAKQHIYFFFPYRCAAIYSFQQNLSMAGIHTDMYCLLPEMMKCIAGAGEDGLAFCTTIEYAETMDVNRLFREFRRKGVEIALFASELSRYDQYADYKLCRSGSSSGVLSQLLLYDMYFYALSDMFRNHYLPEQ